MFNVYIHTCAIELEQFVFVSSEELRIAGYVIVLKLQFFHYADDIKVNEILPILILTMFDNQL